MEKTGIRGATLGIIKITSNRTKIGDPGGTNGSFYPGHNLTPIEKYSEEGHQRRLQGLRKTWTILSLKSKGIPVKTKAGEKKVYRRKRLRLRSTLAKEYRDIQDMARTYAHEAMKKMAEIVQDPNSHPMAIIAATNVILERGYGKANQPNTNLNMDMNGKTNEIGTKELDQRVAKTLERIEAITGRAPPKVRRKEQLADVCELDRDTGGTKLH